MNIRTCRSCQFWYESSVFSTHPEHRRLCVKQASFKRANDSCGHWLLTRDKILCPALNKVVLTHVCREAMKEECRTCPYRELFLLEQHDHILHRSKRKPIVPLYNEKEVTMDFVDGRDKIHKAWRLLYDSGLLAQQVNLEPILTATGNELKQLIEDFLDAVETIPLALEDKIPEYVVQVYNDIVDGKIGFLDRKLGDMPIIVEEGEYKFRRRNIQ